MVTIETDLESLVYKVLLEHDETALELLTQNNPENFLDKLCGNSVLHFLAQKIALMIGISYDNKDNEHVDEITFTKKAILKLSANKTLVKMKDRKCKKAIEILSDYCPLFLSENVEMKNVLLECAESLNPVDFDYISNMSLSNIKDHVNGHLPRCESEHYVYFPRSRAFCVKRTD